MSKNQNLEASSKPGKVRQANSSDVSTLVLLNAHVQDLHAGLYPADFEAEPNSEELRKFYSALVNREKHLIGLFETSQAVLAYIWFEEIERPGSPFMKASRVLHVHHIAVHPDARRKGVGSALMSWAEKHANASGISQITMEHWAANQDAHEFFGLLGFENVRFTMRRQVRKSDENPL